MKKLILASVSAIALFGIAACSDSSDSTTTQSVPPVEEPATPPATNVTPPADPAPMQPAPAEPAPAPAPAQ